MLKRPSARARRRAQPCVVLAALLVVAVVPGARAASLPTLTLRLDASTVSVSGSAQSGAVDVVSVASGVKEASAILVLLRPGVSPAELYAVLASKEAQDPNALAKLGSILFDAEAAP